MEFLKWISFGTWAGIPITPDDLALVIGMSVAFICFVVVKTLAIIIMDFGHLRKGFYPKMFSIIIRVLQAFLYLVLLNILGLFHNPNLFYFLIGCYVYFVFVGIAVVSGDLESDYLWKFNEYFKELCNNWGDLIKAYEREKEQFNNINKRINDYRKKAIIG